MLASTAALLLISFYDTLVATTMAVQTIVCDDGSICGNDGICSNQGGCCPTSAPIFCDTASVPASAGKCCDEAHPICVGSGSGGGGCQATADTGRDVSQLMPFSDTIAAKNHLDVPSSNSSATAISNATATSNATAKTNATADTCTSCTAKTLSNWCWLDDTCYTIGNPLNPCADDQCVSRSLTSKCACSSCRDARCEPSPCEKCIAQRMTSWCGLDDSCYSVGNPLNPCKSSQCVSGSRASECACSSCLDAKCANLDCEKCTKKSMMSWCGLDDTCYSVGNPLNPCNSSHCVSGSVASKCACSSCRDARCEPSPCEKCIAQSMMSWCGLNKTGKTCYSVGDPRNPCNKSQCVSGSVTSECACKSCQDAECQDSN